MADFSKIGKNNKNRGRTFERAVAEKLGWSRVPYSGAIKEWGGADVVDGFYQRLGHWAGECKTQQGGTTGSISIKDKWVKQMMGGETGGRHGVIITKNVRSRNAYVFMLEDTHSWMLEFALASCKTAWGKEEAKDMLYPNFIVTTKLLGKGHNFVVKADELPCASDGFTRIEIGETTWYVIHLDDFAITLETYRMFHPEMKNADGK